MNKIIDESKLIEWEINHSTFAQKIKLNATYEECRNYSCQDISRRTNQSFIFEDKDTVIELPFGTDFHFIGRVDTNVTTQPYKRQHYYEVMQKRTFASFTTINKKNISRHRGRPFLIYNILPQDIVHVFPIDSDTSAYSKTELELSALPSWWLSLNELEKLSWRFGMYNQVTCKTKRNGEVIMPIAVAAFESITEDILQVAKTMEVGIVLVHPEKDAISYQRDSLCDYNMINRASTLINELCGFDLLNLIYLN